PACTSPRPGSSRSRRRGSRSRTRSLPTPLCRLSPATGYLSAVEGQGDAAASGLWVQHRPDGRRVAVDLVGEGLEHSVVGSTDQLTVLGGDAVEGAVAEPDGAVGVVVGFVAAGG